ncbi:beta-lactamase family protein [Maribacter sp.]|nr:beta-lactamase family protein [Maribacter sp.]
MGRFKILAGVALALALLFLIFKGGANDVVPQAGPDALTKAKEDSVNKAGVQRYHLGQERLKAALSIYFDKAITSGDIVGAGVSIVLGDSILISAGYGKRNSSEKAKVNGETVFRLGSLSKGFAGVLAADLKAEGKLKWEDKITDYIPEFQLGDSENTAKIKISHILSHSSGTPYHSFTNLVEAGLPMADIAKRFHEVNPQNEPGLQYSYQNAMFALAQEIFLKTAGADVKMVLQNRFFTPLGMTTVSMDHETLVQGVNVAVPHGKGGAGWRNLPLKDRYYNAVIAGGIDASALDMAKWMRFLLGHNQEVMKKEAIAESFQPVIALRDNNKYYQRWSGHLKSAYGFGWRIHTFEDVDTKEDVTIWHHGGSVNNYRNEIAIYPKADLGICVLLNSNSSLASTVIPDLYALVKRSYN